jgi:hypothetical protein
MDAGTDGGHFDGGAADAGAADAGTADAGTADAGTADAGTADAGTADAGTALALPSCLGTALPMQQSGQLPFVTVKLGAAPGSPGAFLIDFASTASWVDLQGFTAPVPVPTSCLGNPAIPGALCQFSDFDYFGSWGQVALTTADYSALTTTPRECGILGTDFLSLNPTVLDFGGHRIISSKGGTFCADAELIDAGFSSLSTVGFFTNNPNTLTPLSQVITDGGASVIGYTVPNVPTVKVRVAGVEALAQFDTGFDDNLVRHSININEAYFQALLAQAPTALVRDVALDQFISTCVGLTENAEGYRLAAGQSAAFVSETGALLRSQPNAVLFVKHTPAAARICGGIGTWNVPAAQIAGSYFVEASAVIFDPVRQRVWLPR